MLLVSLINLGSAILDLGKTKSEHVQDALATHQQAEAIAVELGDQKRRAQVLSALVQDHYYLQQINQAQELSVQALDLFSRLGMTQDEAELLEFLENHTELEPI